MAVEFRLLGPLEVLDHDGQQLAMPRGHARSLLALLALHPGQVLSTDRLVDVLWGHNPPATATTALQGHVSTLRKKLAPGRDSGDERQILVTHTPGYMLAVDPDQVDANRFRRLVHAAMHAPPLDRARELGEALGLWRGPALADFAYEPFAQTAITALEEQRTAALEARIGADLELGRHAGLIGELDGLVEEHPLHEGLRAQLMVALYRCGRQAEALEVYGDLRRHLVDDLGVDPSPRLQKLHRAILDQDAALTAHHAIAVVQAGGDERSTAESAWFTAGRRTVTVAFVDLTVRSITDATMDPEATSPVVDQTQALVRSTVEYHGGRVAGAAGDVVAAFFGTPVAHEDDAVRAVRSAASLREALSRLNQDVEQRGMRVQARVGIDTGEVVVPDPTDADDLPSGPPVARAARLQQAAGDGEVFVTDSTWRLVQAVALVDPVADGAIPGQAWRLSDVVEDATGFATADTPLVGRRSELAALTDALDDTVQRGRASLVTVMGEAGVGKSRLARAFTDQTDGLNVAVGRCRAYGEGITFRPMRELVQDLTGAAGTGDLAEVLADEPTGPFDPEQIAAAVGLGGKDVGHTRTLFRAVRQLLDVVSRQRPVVAVLEDLHWAQPTLLDLVEFLANEVQAPALLLCLSRPDLRAHRPGWAASVAAATTITLEPLTTPEARNLVVERLGGRLLAPETMGQVLAMGQGNPLFLEQLIAALRGNDELTLPPTVDALLAARLDRLGPAERDLLRAAAVVGVEVANDALAVLLPDQARPYMSRHLDALTDKELIHPRTGSPSRRPGFEFGHVLIQQAAYRSLTHAARARLHEQLADWLGSGPDDHEPDREELIGHHLEQAYRHRRVVGQSDRDTAQLAVHAGELLATSGLRVYERFDVPAAANLLARARELLPPDHDLRPRVLRRLTEAYPIMGRRQEAEDAFAELLDHVERHGDELAIHRTRLEQTRFRMITGPDPIPLATIRKDAEEALETFRQAGNDVGVSQAHYVLASVHLRAGRIAELEEVGRRAIEAAARTGDLRERLGAPWWVVFAMLAGPTPIPTCIRTCEEVAEVGEVTHPGALAALGHFKAMVGQFDEGRQLTVRARDLLHERIGVPRPLAFIGQQRAGIEQLAGRAAPAVDALREALDISVHVGDRDQTGQIAARLSLLLAGQGRNAEAGRLADMAFEQAPAASVTAQALARAARSRNTLNRGDVQMAVTVACEGLGLVPGEMLELQALLHARLSAALLAHGQVDEARATAVKAIELYRRKGNTVAVQLAADRRPN